MTSFTCPNCRKTSFPGFVLSGAGKLIVECPNPECLFQDQNLGPADFNTGVAAIQEDGAGEGNGWAGKRAVTVERETPSVAPARPIAAAPRQAPYAGPAATAAAPGDVLGWIEDRALWLGAEEARLEGEVADAQSRIAGARAERKKLEQMLKAGRRQAGPKHTNGVAIVSHESRPDTHQTRN